MNFEEIKESTEPSYQKIGQKKITGDSTMFKSTFKDSGRCTMTSEEKSFSSSAFEPDTDQGTFWSTRKNNSPPRSAVLMQRLSDSIFSCDDKEKSKKTQKTTTDCNENKKNSMFSSRIPFSFDDSEVFEERETSWNHHDYYTSSIFSETFDQKEELNIHEKSDFSSTPKHHAENEVEKNSSPQKQNFSSYFRSTFHECQPSTSQNQNACFRQPDMIFSPIRKTPRNYVEKSKKFAFGKFTATSNDLSNPPSLFLTPEKNKRRIVERRGKKHSTSRKKKNSIKNAQSDEEYQSWISTDNIPLVYEKSTEIQHKPVNRNSNYFNSTSPLVKLFESRQELKKSVKEATSTCSNSFEFELNDLELAANEDVETNEKGNVEIKDNYHQEDNSSMKSINYENLSANEDDYFTISNALSSVDSVSDPNALKMFMEGCRVTIKTLYQKLTSIERDFLNKNSDLDQSITALDNVMHIYDNEQAYEAIKKTYSTELNNRLFILKEIPGTIMEAEKYYLKLLELWIDTKARNESEIEHRELSIQLEFETIRQIFVEIAYNYGLESTPVKFPSI